MIKLRLFLTVLVLIAARPVVAAESKCAIPLKQSCLTKLPSDWQPPAQPGSVPITIDSVCLTIADYPPDPDLCIVSGAITISMDIAGFIAGYVSNTASVHNDDLDLWVKAGGLEPGDAHTIRTVTYMQATTFRKDLGIKSQTDEWHPDVKCTITLQNPEDAGHCQAVGQPTPSAGLLKASSSCKFNQNKNNTVLKDVGAVLLGALGGNPINFVKSIISLNPPSPANPGGVGVGDFAAAGAVEVAQIYTCPDDVQSINNGAKLLVSRQFHRDNVLVRQLADQWNQEPMLAAHLRGEVPKTITAAKGDSYWRLADQYYSSGRYWVGVAQANNWHAIVPGSTVQIPPMQELLFAPCYVRQRESLWTAGARLKAASNRVQVADTKSLMRPKGRDSIYPLERLRVGPTGNCSK